MSKQTQTNLFIVPSIPRLYQRLLSGVASHSELGNRIIREIKTAHAFRQVDNVRELARVLSNSPLKEYRLIGQYYLVWCKCRELNYHDNILERIAEESSTYKSKALTSRAAFEVFRGNFEHAFYFYLESLKPIPTLSDYLVASRGIATLKSVEGFNRSALKDLERLIPLLRYAEPIVYYDVLNSYAVELTEASRKDEARNIMRHVLASPFAKSYPEWRSTAEDLKPANRSFAVLRPTRIRKGKLLFMPQPEYVESTEAGSLAPVISLPEWKQKMAKDNDKPKLEDMTESEIMMEIIHTVSAFDMPYEKRLKVLESIRKIMSEPSKPDDDDED